MRKKIKYVNQIVLFVAMMGIGYSYSQDDSQRLINNFFTTYEKDKGQAFDSIFKSNPYFTKTQISYIKDTLNKFLSQLENYCGYELVHTQFPGNSKSMVLYYYIVKYERQPVKFVFVFYKPKETWMLYNFLFNGEVDTDLIDAAKISLFIKE